MCVQVRVRVLQSLLVVGEPCADASAVQGWQRIRGWSFPLLLSIICRIGGAIAATSVRIEVSGSKAGFPMVWFGGREWWECYYIGVWEECVSAAVRWPGLKADVSQD